MYIRVLQIWKNFLQAVTQDCDCFDLGWEQNRIERLRTDLKSLGTDDTDFLKQPSLPTERPGWLGVLYVIRGASMGNRMISRQLLSMPNKDIKKNCRFFSQDNGNEIKKWHEFRSFVESQSWCAASTAATIDGARQTFDFLTKEYDKPITEFPLR